MREDDILRMYQAASKKYPAPCSYWSKTHFDIRVSEIHEIEKVIFMCMDSTRDLTDILEDELWNLEYLIRNNKNEKLNLWLNKRYEVVNFMLNYISSL